MDAVLLVEDEQPMRSLLERWLKTSGYFAEVAASADEALDVASSCPPAVAICDLVMPGHDGAWLARQLRARYPDTALIVATGSPDLRTLGELPGGIVEYLFKPFSRERLNVAVQRGFSWHRASGTRRWTERLARQQFDRSRVLQAKWETMRIDSREMLVSALRTLMACDEAAYEHAMRVSRLAGLACRKLGVAEPETEQIEQAAMLHDFGKLAMPEAILAKPAPLTPEERDMMRRHPDITYQFVRGHHLLGRIADIVRGANEWFGGGGYPVGLDGTDIPLGSRIIAVADAYDTMTHARVYRDAMTPAEAALELMRCCGAQFDPEVVGAFLAALTAH